MLIVGKIAALAVLDVPANDGLRERLGDGMRSTVLAHVGPI